MTPELLVFQKSVTSAFILDKAKLARMLDILEQRYIDIESPFRPTLDVLLSNGRRISVSNIDQLFALDNSVKNPIRSLTISTMQLTDEMLSCTITFNSSGNDNVALKVEALSNKVASQTFAELEEQVERTLSSSLVHKLTFGNVVGTIGLGIGFVMLILALIYGVDDNSSFGPGYVLSVEELNTFAQRAGAINTTEEKVNFLFDLQKRQLERSVRKSNLGLIPLNRALTLKNLFIFLPVIVIVGCLAYLSQFAYPYAVFLWGDYEEKYERLVSLRRTIWTVIIASFFVGVLGNMFVFGISSAIR